MPINLFFEHLKFLKNELLILPQINYYIQITVNNSRGQTINFKVLIHIYYDSQYK